MKKTNLLKSVLIPSLSLVTFSTIAVASTSCGSMGSDEPNNKNMVVRAIAPSIVELVTHRTDTTYNVPNLQYSVDGKNWESYEKPFAISKGQVVYLKGNNQKGFSYNEQNYSNFVFSGNVSISGNIMGLLDSGEGTMKVIPNSYCFYDLFRDCTVISNVNKTFLSNIQSLTDHCLDGLFYNCMALKNAPDLPQVNLLAQFCYNFMFCRCVSLVKAPDLPSLSLSENDWDYCYGSMFRYCASLKSIKIGYRGEYNETYFKDWVEGVAKSGIFYYNGDQVPQDFKLPDGWIKRTFAE